MVNQQYSQRGYSERQPSLETNGVADDKVPALNTWKDQQFYKEDEPWYRHLESAHYALTCSFITVGNIVFTSYAFLSSSGYEYSKHGASIGFFVASLIFIEFTKHHTRKNKDDENVRHNY